MMIMKEKKEKIVLCVRIYIGGDHIAKCFNGDE